MTDMPQVGTRLDTHDQFDMLPQGTKIRQGEANHTYTKGDEGWVYDPDGGIYQPYDFAMRQYVVVSLPWDVPARENLRQYQWRYRQVTLWGTIRNSIETDVFEGAMEELGTEFDKFPVGVGMEVRVEYDRNQLPEGTLVVTGDPADYARFGMWTKKNGAWEKVLGAKTLNRYTQVKVRAIAGEEVHQDWIDTPGTDEDELAILEFKSKAYKVGRELKSEHDWCGTYDSVVEAAGVTHNVVRELTQARSNFSVPGHRVGEHVTQEEVAELPEGTIVKWVSTQHPVTRQVWYMRVDWATNSTKTKRIFGYRDDRPVVSHTARGLVIAAFKLDDEFEPYSIPIGVGEMTDLKWNNLPPGTRFRYGSDQNSTYMMYGDHRATVWHVNRSYDPTNGRGQHALSAYNADSNEFTITYLPTPQQEQP